MYNLADKSFTTRPKIMSEATRDDLFARIVEHIEIHDLKHVVIILHGGEPLMAGKKYIHDWATTAINKFKNKTELHLRLQTNGILLDSEWIDVLYQNRIRIGISLDGPKNYNDIFRVDHIGNGSYDKVKKGIDQIIEHKHGEDVFGSILSVCNPRIPAKEMWEFWLSLGLTRFDFNLPHNTHDNPPWFEKGMLTRWMVELFDLWWNKNDTKYEIRFFRNIINLLLGAQFSTDYIGGKPGGIGVIETDGSIQATDALKACEDGLVNLGLFVQYNSLDEAVNNPIVRLSNHSSSQLCETCLKCRANEVCGGGYLPHRYSKSQRFNNPSIYCDSLYAIINHIRTRILECTPELIR